MRDFDALDKLCIEKAVDNNSTHTKLVYVINWPVSVHFAAVSELLKHTHKYTTTTMLV